MKTLRNTMNDGMAFLQKQVSFLNKQPRGVFSVVAEEVTYFDEHKCATTGFKTHLQSFKKADWIIFVLFFLFFFVNPFVWANLVNPVISKKS